MSAFWVAAPEPTHDIVTIHEIKSKEFPRSVGHQGHLAGGGKDSPKSSHSCVALGEGWQGEASPWAHHKMPRST